MTSYLGSHPVKGGLSNFRYICHPAFGDFLISNSSDLTLIISELKVGHCDILSWYLAARLRAQGIIAWVTTDTITTKDGAAFNASCLHSRVLYVTKEGKLKYLDPTLFCDFDPAFHPVIMSEEHVKDLQRKYSSATTRAEKIAVLREFNAGLPKLRKIAAVGHAENPEVRRDERNLALLAFARALASDDPTNREVENRLRSPHSKTSWVSGRHILTLAELAPEIKDLLFRFGYDPLDANELKSMEDRLSRERLKLCFESLRHHSISLSPTAMEYAESGAMRDDHFERLKARQGGSNVKVECSSIYCGDGQHRNLSVLTPPSLDPSAAKLLQNYPSSLPVHEILQTQLLAGSIDNVNSDGILALNFIGSPASVPEYSPRFLELIHNQQFPKTNYPKNTSQTMISSLNPPYQRIFIGPARDHGLNALNLCVELQRALESRDYRNLFLERLGIDEEYVRKFAEFYLRIDPGKRRAIINEAKPDGEIQKNLGMIGEIFYAGEECQRRIQASVKQLLKRIDQQQVRGVEFERFEATPYQPGDDIRYVDHNLFARSDTLYTRKIPQRILGSCSPLHVLIQNIDYTYNGLQYLQINEIIRTLQREAEREIFVGTFSLGLSNTRFVPRNGYLKLSGRLKSMAPDHICSILTTFDNSDRDASVEGQRFAGPRLANGKLPRNLLVVGNITSCLAMKYLYGQPGSGCNVHSLWQDDRRYQMLPRIRESWVKQGSVRLRPERQVDRKPEPTPRDIAWDLE